MAIALNARLVIKKADLQAQYVNTDTDDAIVRAVENHLRTTLPAGWSAETLTVEIERGVSRKDELADVAAARESRARERAALSGYGS